LDPLDHRFQRGDPDFDLHFHPLSGTIVPPDNLADMDRIMALAVTYSKTLANGLFVHLPDDFDPNKKAIDFATHWQDLRLVYFKGAFHATAAAAAANVVITDEMLDVDDLIFRHSGSILAPIMAKQAAQKPGRYNAARCTAMFKDDEDFDLLMELATRGAIIDPDSEFMRQSVPEDMRQTEVLLTKVFSGSWYICLGQRKRRSGSHEYLARDGPVTTFAFQPFPSGVQV